MHGRDEVLIDVTQLGCPIS